MERHSQWLTAVLYEISLDSVLGENGAVLLLLNLHFHILKKKKKNTLILMKVNSLKKETHLNMEKKPEDALPVLPTAWHHYPQHTCRKHTHTHTRGDSGRQFWFPLLEHLLISWVEPGMLSTKHPTACLNTGQPHPTQLTVRPQVSLVHWLESPCYKAPPAALCNSCICTCCIFTHSLAHHSIFGPLKRPMWSSRNTCVWPKGSLKWLYQIIFLN